MDTKFGDLKFLMPQAVTRHKVGHDRHERAHTPRYGHKLCRTSLAGGNGSEWDEWAQRTREFSGIGHTNELLSPPYRQSRLIDSV